MKSNWTGYSIAGFMAGVVLFAQFCIEGLKTVWKAEYANWVLPLIFSAVFIIISIIFKGDKHP